MLNYIKAELYKVRQRTYLLHAILIILGLESLFILVWTFPHRPEFYQIVTSLDALMPVGLVLTLVFVDLIFSNQYRHNTLKNECSFGISRRCIYLGKFCAELLLALGILALILTSYLSAGWVLALHGDPSMETKALQSLGIQLLSSLPLWIASLSIAHFLFFLIKSDVLSICLLVGSYLLGAPLLTILSSLTFDLFQPVSKALIFLLPNIRFALAYRLSEMEYLLGNWLVGLGWLAITNAVGLTIFQKRALY